mmetsp:Transcript_384/g.1328  ORF Transcript_384/g.1328 Transcript_384/m.1328 type:complete len:207 (-) Transcript_384:409-1029(-)
MRTFGNGKRLPIMRATRGEMSHAVRRSLRHWAPWITFSAEYLLSSTNCFFSRCCGLCQAEMRSISWPTSTRRRRTRWGEIFGPSYSTTGSLTPRTELLSMEPPSMELLSTELPSCASLPELETLSLSRTPRAGGIASSTLKRRLPGVELISVGRLVAGSSEVVGSTRRSSTAVQKSTSTLTSASTCTRLPGSYQTGGCLNHSMAAL